jgi:transposase
MNNMTSSVGVDVAKDALDISIGSNKPFRVLNDEASIVELVPILPQGCTVYLEASGGHERLLRRMLQAAGISVVRHDPLRVRRMVQAQCKTAKTDALDAKNLAIVGPSLPIREQKSKQHEESADISRAVEQLKITAAEFKMRARTPQLEPGVQKSYLRAAKILEAEAAMLHSRFEKLSKNTEIGKRYDLAKSVPGVGATLARVCACEMPELTKATTAQVASYAGVAPIDNSSGKKQGIAHIRRGCVRLKKALYMPALSAVRHQPWATTLYRKLRTKGKAHQAAIVAVMRRLLIRIAAVLKRGSPWKDEPIKT